MFPKKGNFFPGIGVYREAVAAALRAELGENHLAAKTVMQWTGANERTVKNWLSGHTGPSGEHLIGLLHHSDRTLGTVLQLAGREPIPAARSLFEARTVLAETLERLDLWLGQSIPATP